MPSKSSLLKLVERLESQLTLIMVISDTIDISSSDSELEIEDGRDTHSANLRKLPNSLAGSGTSSSFRGQIDLSVLKDFSILNFLSKINYNEISLTCRFYWAV